MKKVIGINSRDYVNKSAIGGTKVNVHKVLSPKQKDTVATVPNISVKSAFEGAVAAKDKAEEKPRKVLKGNNTGDTSGSDSGDGVPQKEFVYKASVAEESAKEDNTDTTAEKKKIDVVERQRMLGTLVCGIIQSSLDRGLGE